ncbi:MAG: response regulator [Flexilinea sp.]
MISLVIVDDERNIIELVKNLIDPEMVDVSITGEAENGLAAYDLIIEKKPDVVITDIRMPGLTGIELIQKVHQQGLSVSFIVISGYREFDYAQTALKFGVADYLLKPIKKSELNQLLARLDNKKDDEIVHLNKVHTMEKKLAMSTNLLRKNALWDLLSCESGRIKSCSDIMVKKDYFNCNPGSFLIGIIKLDSLNQEDEIEFSLATTEAIVGKFARSLSTDCYDVEYVCKESTGYLYLHFGEEHKSLDEKREYLKEMIHNDSYKYDFFNITIGFGKTVQSVDELSVSYLTAIRAIRIRIDEGLGTIILYDRLEDKYKKPEVDLLNTEKQKISRYIENLDSGAIRETIHDIFLRVHNSCNNAYLFYGLSCEILLQVYNLLAENMKDCEILSPEKVISSVDNCISPVNLERLCLDYADRSITLCVEQKSNMESKPIRIIRQYLQDNFNKPVTLEEAAQKVFLTPIYVSTIFKKETGTSFTNYLIDIRMNEAKRLLRETSLNVSEIANKVGYHDIKYFSKLFIKIVGIKPVEYRKFYS